MRNIYSTVLICTALACIAHGRNVQLSETIREANRNATEWCHKELGISGICHALEECYCYCYDIKEGDSSIKVNTFFRGEFGAELLTHIPHVYHLHQSGALGTSYGVPGSSALAVFSPHHKELNITRKSNCPGLNGYFQHSRPFRDYFPYWSPPPLSTYYKEWRKSHDNMIPYPLKELTSPDIEKPLFIIHNKYTRQWGNDPVNYIDADTLNELFEMLLPHYTVLYIRPGAAASKKPGYTADRDILTLPGEFEVLQRFSEVWNFDEILEKTMSDKSRIDPALHSFNAIQLLLHAHADNFISVQGGNSVLASYFSKTNLVFFKDGKELRKPNEFDEVYSKLGVEPVEMIVVERYQDLIQQARMHFVDNNHKRTHARPPPTTTMSSTSNTKMIEPIPSQAATSTPRKIAAGDNDNDSDTNSNSLNIHTYNTPKPQKWAGNPVWFVFVCVMLLVGGGYFLSGLWSTLYVGKVIA
jgi:hypothetical protein